MRKHSYKTCTPYPPSRPAPHPPSTHLVQATPVLRTCPKREHYVTKTVQTVMIMS